MDDGYWPFSFLLFFAFILLEAGFYGFGDAVKNINKDNLMKEVELGNKKGAKLLRIVNRPARFVNTLQIATNVTGMVMGAYILKQWSRKFEAVLWQAGNVEGSFLKIISMVIIGIMILVCLVCFGVIIPKSARPNHRKSGHMPFFPLSRQLRCLCFLLPGWRQGSPL